MHVPTPNPIHACAMKEAIHAQMQGGSGGLYGLRAML